MNLTYEQSIKLLQSNAKFKIELGLERISKILDILGNPQNDFIIIHVAGTNGKGSVCSITAKILECAGFKTALYTSPHLVEYTERIKINSKDISKEDFANILSYVVEKSNENNIELTEFEILTAAAFKYFSDQKVEYSIIETGLGGRFDATNVEAKNKILSVITSISIDHKNILGDTIEKIANEKAGIIKKNIPVVVSTKNKGYEVIKKRAQELNSPILIPKREVKIEFENGINYVICDGGKFEFPLLGLFQKENLELVFEVFKYLSSIFELTCQSEAPKYGDSLLTLRTTIAEESHEKRIKYKCLTQNLEQFITEALKTVQWKSRFQFIKDKNLVIDGAHNEGAAKVLRESLDFYFPSSKRIFIFGAMNTKEYQKVAKILFRPKDTVYFYQFKDKRAICLEDFKKCCPSAQEISLEYIAKKLLKQVQNDTITIACGSFYVTGEVTKLL